MGYLQGIGAVVREGSVGQRRATDRPVHGGYSADRSVDPSKVVAPSSGTGVTTGGESDFIRNCHIRAGDSGVVSLEDQVAETSSKANDLCAGQHAEGARRYAFAGGGSVVVCDRCGVLYIPASERP